MLHGWFNRVAGAVARVEAIGQEIDVQAAHVYERGRRDINTAITWTTDRAAQTVTTQFTSRFARGIRLN